MGGRAGEVGSGEGDGVGGDVSSDVGRDVGSGVGEDEGDGVGGDVGSGVGDDVGSGVGDDVGSGVGDDEGDGVGKDVGSGVGESEVEIMVSKAKSSSPPSPINGCFVGVGVGSRKMSSGCSLVVGGFALINVGANVNVVSLSKSSSDFTIVVDDDLSSLEFCTANTIITIKTINIMNKINNRHLIFDIFNFFVYISVVTELSSSSSSGRKIFDGRLISDISSIIVGFTGFDVNISFIISSTSGANCDVSCQPLSSSGLWPSAVSSFLLGDVDVVAVLLVKVLRGPPPLPPI